MTDYVPTPQGVTTPLRTPLPTSCPICGLTEAWVPVHGFKGAYEISTTGRVRSLDVRRRAGYGKTRLVKGGLLTSRRVTLSMPGRQRPVIRDILFVEHFLEVPAGATHTFLDGNSAHLCLGNIAWEYPYRNYRQMHRKIARERGLASAQSCVSCDKQAEEWSYDKSGTHEAVDMWNERTVRYSLDPMRYLPRCRKCHRGIDGWWLKRSTRAAA